jgi:hypothetical protein
MDKVEIDTIFPKNNTATTRGHKYKIYKKHCRTNRRKYTFSQRVIAHWNALPESVIDATNVNSFKNRLNNHWENIEFLGNMVSISTLSIPFMILKVSTTSALILLY